MTDKFNILSDNEKVVLQTMTMQMNTKKALEYLKEEAIEMSERTYFRCKKKVENKVAKTLPYSEIFTDQHLERIDRLEVSGVFNVGIITRKNPIQEGGEILCNCPTCSPTYQTIMALPVSSSKRD